MFRLEALSAKHGDALLLHYGTGGTVRHILIDGGPTGVYRATLRPRLKALQDPSGAPLPLRMVMVSHLDADHITGVLDLFSDMGKARDRGDPLPYEIATLWLNSFDDALSATSALAPAAAAGLRLQSLRSGVAPRGLPLADDVLADLASVSQGIQLRNQARALGTSLNAPFPQLVSTPGSGAKKVPIGDGLVFTVVGPSTKRIDALKAEWMKKTRNRQVAPAELAEYVDRSVYNLSSILVLASFGQRRMLLTGDARGDDILEVLKTATLLERGSLHLDLLKVPHHGSVRNVEQEFFEKVTADHYVISADGKYDNPDVKMLEMLTQARGDDAYTIWFTNKVPRAARFLAKDRKDRRRKYTVCYREPQAPSIEVKLD